MPSPTTMAAMTTKAITEADITETDITRIVIPAMRNAITGATLTMSNAAAAVVRRGRSSEALLERLLAARLDEAGMNIAMGTGAEERVARSSAVPQVH